MNKSNSYDFIMKNDGKLELVSIEDITFSMTISSEEEMKIWMFSDSITYALNLTDLSFATIDNSNGDVIQIFDIREDLSIISCSYLKPKYQGLDNYLANQMLSVYKIAAEGSFNEVGITDLCGKKATYLKKISIKSLLQDNIIEMNK